MGGDYSSQFLNELRFPNYAGLHCLIRARRLVSAVRSVQRTFYRSPAASPLSVSQQTTLILSALEGQQEHYRTHRWAYMEDVLDSALHVRLVSEWPNRMFLDPPREILKSYDSGFRWERGKRDPDYLERHPTLKVFLDYLRSESFGRRMSAFIGGHRQISCYSFVVTSTHPGSCVAPHRDSVYYSPEARHFLNVLFFINGSGGSRSGGLSILKDNHFSEILFEPTRLQNTALIYDSGAPFFHGFRPIAKGKFRWAVAAQFCAPDFFKQKTWL